MLLPASVVALGLAIHNQSSDGDSSITQSTPPTPTPTVQDKWTTVYPYHTPTAHLIMVPYLGFGCERANMLADMSEEGMIGLGECFPVSQAASFLWYGKINCAVTLHSGTDCGGWEWAVEMGICYSQTFGSYRAYC